MENDCQQLENGSLQLRVLNEMDFSIFILTTLTQNGFDFKIGCIGVFSFLWHGAAFSQSFKPATMKFITITLKKEEVCMTKCCIVSSQDGNFGIDLLDLLSLQY